MTENLWLDAAKLVPEKWQDQLSALTDLSYGPDALLSKVSEEKEKCIRQQWSCRGLNGHKVYVRDILQRVTFWLEKVKSVGDVVASYDPAHAALPWAGARFLIQAVTSDVKAYGAMLEAVEVVVGTMSRYRLIEIIYLSRDATGSYLALQTSVASVYREILIFLCKARKNFSQNTAVRILSSFVQLDRDFSTLTQSITVQDVAMEKLRPLLDAEMTEKVFTRVEDVANDNKVMRDTLTDVECSMKGMSSTLQDVNDGMQREERLKILRWLSTEQYPAHHKRISRQRLEGSGEWFFSKPQYKSWRNSSLCSLLWLHGRPGAGKSVLTSLVIDAIAKELREQPDPIPLAFFYCTRESSEPRRANPTEVLLSILKQLSCKNPGEPIISSVTSKYRERLDLGSEHRLDLDECVEIIIEITSITGAIIVIDALDECEEATRGTLLDTIDKIIQESERQVHIFVSSRPNWDIKHHFRRTPRLEIATGDISNDISDYVISELENRVRTGKFLGGHPPADLVEQVRDYLISNADGIFRWASASIQTLCDPRMQHPNDVRLALGRLPSDIDDVYAIILNQIHSGSPWTMPLAKKALRWMLYAQQALGSGEFIKSLSTDTDGLESSITVDLILNICCNLVMYDQELDVIRFVHLSVREFLEKKAGTHYSMTPSNASIAEACLQSCINGVRPKRKVHLLSNQNRTFYDYAMIYWPLHCSQASEFRLEGKLSKLLNDYLYDGNHASRDFLEWQASYEESWEEMDMGGADSRHPNHQFRDRLQDCQSTDYNPVYLSCAFGFLEVLQNPRRFSARDAKKMNPYGRNPFTIAVRHGQQEVVALLASMATGNDDTNDAALIAAITMSRTPLIQYLLENNAALEIKKDDFEAAVSNSDLATIQLLLQHEKFDPPEVSTQLLSYAAGNELGGQEAINLLLERDEYAEIDANILRIACRNRSQGLAILQRLFNHEEQTTIPDDAAEYAAEYAAENSSCGAALLATLFQRSRGLVVTDAMLESAASCTSVEPMRFLLAQSIIVRPNYQCLCIAVENVECGDEMMDLLIPRCDRSFLDTGLLYVALENRKLASVLVRRLLAGSIDNPIHITTEALRLAATNKFGEQILEQILPLFNPQKITSNIAIDGAANYYAPVEILKLLTEADKTLEFTTDVLESGAANPQYAFEIMTFFLSYKEDLLAVPEVVEAIAANKISGLEIFQCFGDRSIFHITPKAVENAAGNRKLGDKILGYWYRHKLPMIVSETAVELAMRNILGQEILKILFRINPRIRLTDGAWELMVGNVMCATSLLKMAIRHQGSPQNPEMLLWLSTRNAEFSLELIEIFNNVLQSPTTVFGLEAGLSWHATNDGLMRILQDATSVSISQNALLCGLCYSKDTFALLKALLKRKPDLELPDSAMCFIVSRVGSVAALVEIFGYLSDTGREVKITTSMLKWASRGMLTFDKISTFLEKVCTEHKLEITLNTEVIYTILRSWDPRRFDALDRVIALDSQSGRSFTVTKELFKTAFQDKQAEIFFSSMKKHGKTIDESITEDPECRLLAAVCLHLTDRTLLDVFGMNAIEISSLRASEAGIVKMIQLASDQFALKSALLALDSSWSLTSSILIAALKKRWDTILRFLLNLLTKRKSNAISELVNDTVMLAIVESGHAQSIMYLLRFLRQNDTPVPITAKIIDLAAGQGTDIFTRIIQCFLEQNPLSELRVLITTTTTKRMVHTWAGFHNFNYLSGILGRPFLISLFTEDSLSSAPVLDTMLDLIFTSITPLHPKEYYRNISKLHGAVFNINLITMKRLMDEGTNPNIPNCWGRPPLVEGSLYGDFCVVTLLLKYDSVDVDVMDENGRTSLHHAAMRDSNVNAKSLLQRSADRTLVDKDGKTAEVLARECCNYAMEALIAKWGVEDEVVEALADEDVITPGTERRMFLRSSKTF